MNLHRDSSPRPKHFLSSLCSRPFTPGRCVALVAAPRWRFLYRCQVGGASLRRRSCPSRLAGRGQPACQVSGRTARACVCVCVFASTFSISFVCMDTNAIPPCSDRFHITFLPVNTTDDVRMCTCAANKHTSLLPVTCAFHISERERQQTPAHARCFCVCVRFFLHADV